VYTVLVVIHVLVAFAICGVVLLQAGKGADIGSAFGGAGTQAVFGSMGTPTLLTKITGVVALVFVLTSFALTILGGSERGSVVRPAPPAATPAPAPAAPPAAPANK
jgi:preprotein translocase subunit SecG